MSSTSRWAAILTLFALGALCGALIFMWRAWPSTTVPLFLGGATLGLIGMAVAFRLTGAAVTLASTGIMLVVAELFLPSFQPVEHKSSYFDPDSRYRSGGYFGEGPHGYQLMPGEYDSRRITNDGEIMYDVIYTIGADHWRVTPPPADRPLPEVPAYDLRFVGGSITFGEGLMDDETLPYQVQEALPGSIAHNHGVHGYGMHQAAAIVERLPEPAPETQRVVVLYSGPWHFARTACRTPFSVGTPRYVINRDRAGPDDPYALRAGWCGLDVPTWLPKSVKRVVDMLQQRSAILAVVRPLMLPPVNEAFELYVALVREIDRMARASGGGLLLAYMDAPERDFAGSDWNDARTIAALQEAGISVLDVSLVETEDLRANPHLILHQLDIHPSAEANRIRGRMIADWLQSGVTGSVLRPDTADEAPSQSRSHSKDAPED